MLFGNANEFAIEAMTEPDLAPPSAVWGRMCVRLPKAVIGDFENPCCALYPVYRQLSQIKNGVSWDELFNGWTDLQILRYLYARFWTDSPETIMEFHRNATRPDDFCFLDCQIGEQFIGFYSFRIQPTQSEVRILYILPNKQVGSASCRKEVFDSAVDGFLNWFDAETKVLQELDL